MRTLDWPENIVADRHEISGKWVLHYLTDAQAQACLSAMNAPTPREQLLAKALEGACNTLEANGIGAAVGRDALAEAGITQEKVV
jgi:hypothetical protein